MTNITDGKWEGEKLSYKGVIHDILQRKVASNVNYESRLSEENLSQGLNDAESQLVQLIDKVEQDAVRRTRNEAANETVSLIRKLSGHYGKVDTDYLEKELMIEVFPEVPIPGDLSAITKQDE